MSVPVKYREMGDFWEYYSGARTAPYLTLFTAGNHEAASHLYELFYGGWVAPNIYYLGASNVLRLGPLRIASMSGIWKGFDYRKPHHERLPFNQDDVKSFYHVREIDVRKLLQLRTQVDIGLSHDWPRAVEKWGDQKRLWRMKPDFERESMDGTLGNVAAEYVLDRLRPPHWFSAHLHCKFAALKRYDLDAEGDSSNSAQQKATEGEGEGSTIQPESAAPAVGNSDEIPLDDDVADAAVSIPNPDEIDLDLDADDDNVITTAPAPVKPPQQSPPAAETASKAPTTAVSEELRAQLPASFTKPPPKPKTTPGQPVPPGITNKQVRFLALDKCLPKRNFLQLLEIHPHSSQPEDAEATPSQPQHPGRFQLQYDPEWLAITRVFHSSFTFGDRDAHVPTDLGEEQYAPLIDAERAWVDEHVVAKKKLDVPANFAVTAPPHDETQNWRGVPEQPFEYTSPQTADFCALLELKNLWDASDEERMARKAAGPAPSSGFRGGGGGHRGDRGGYRGRGGRGGRGRGRGNGRFR
jgi:lariat debranching enzyme